MVKRGEPSSEDWVRGGEYLAKCCCLKSVCIDKSVRRFLEGEKEAIRILFCGVGISDVDIVDVYGHWGDAKDALNIVELLSSATL